MEIFSILIVLGLLASPVASQAACDVGLHLIVSRGSSAPPGTGKAGNLATAIANAVANSTITPLDYPAVKLDGNSSAFVESVAAGVVSLGAAVNDYSRRCPDAKTVLIGSSQGALVTASTLCGTDGTLVFRQNPPLELEFTKNVVAVVLFGDPTHKANASWNAGTSTREGVNPRQNASTCSPYANRMRSWCDTGDVWCDSGTNKSVHGSYFDKYENDVVKYVLSRLNGGEVPEVTQGSNTTGIPISGPSSTTILSGASRTWAAGLGNLVLCLLVAILVF